MSVSLNPILFHYKPDYVAGGVPGERWTRCEVMSSRETSSRSLHTDGVVPGGSQVGVTGR